MAIKKISAGHGLSGSGLGHPENMGVTGPGGKFMGRTMSQDIERKVSTYSGSDSGPSVPGNVGVKQKRTGGMNRKFAGNVGPGGYKGTT